MTSAYLLAQPPSVAAQAIVLTAVRLDTREGIFAADVQVIAIFGDPANPSGLSSIESGQTDASGKYVFNPPPVLAPVPSVWRFTVTKNPVFVTEPSGAMVMTEPGLSKMIDVPVQAPFDPVVGICPEGTDPVVCEISERQYRMADQLSLLNQEWGGQSSFTLDQAHAYLENLDNGPKDPRLKEYWIGDISWGLMDLAIPPLDWPALLEGRRAMRRVLDGVPFPEIGGSDVFRRCAIALPIWTAEDGAEYGPNTFRLFAPSFSSYWPRSDQQMRQDLAARWLMGLMPIIMCVMDKFAAKAKDVERSRKAWGMIGSIASICLAPLTGGAGLVTLFTEAGQIIASEYGLPLGGEVGQGVGAAGLVLGGEPGAQGLLTDSLTKILGSLLPEDINPLARDLALKAVPKIVDIALDQFSVGSAGGALVEGGAPSILGLISLEGLTTGILGQAIGFLVGVIKGTGATKVAHFYEQVMDLQNLPAKMVPLMLWILKVLFLDVIMAAAAQEAGLEDAPGKADQILDPLRKHAADNGVEIPGYLASAAEIEAKKIVAVVVGGAGAIAISSPWWLTLLGLVGGPK